jgi:heme/copper-type cytochrome/quinol oxidase subunit 2
MQLILSESMSPADGMVLAMLTMMGIAMGVIALLIFCMRRNASRRDPEVDALLEEVEAAEKQPTRREAPEPKPWERDSDWWKK